LTNTPRRPAMASCCVGVRRFARVFEVISKHLLFNVLVYALVIVAGIIPALQTDPNFEITEVYGISVHTIDEAITWFYVAELGIKTLACLPCPWRVLIPSFRPLKFNLWNVFDLAVVLMCFLLQTQLSVVRLFRLLKIVKALTAVGTAKQLARGLAASMNSVCYVFMLLALVFYLYAVLGVKLFVDKDPVYFSDLGTATSTLFSIATGGSWSDRMYPLVFSCHGYRYPSCTSWDHLGGLGVLYFTSFVLLAALILLNLIVGVMIMAMRSPKEEEEIPDTLGLFQRALIKLRLQAPPGYMGSQFDYGFRVLQQELDTQTAALQELRSKLSAIHEARLICTERHLRRSGLTSLEEGAAKRNCLVQAWMQLTAFWRKVANSPFFTLFNVLVVLVAVTLIGIQTEPGAEHLLDPDVYVLVDECIRWAFVGEAFIKFLAVGCNLRKFLFESTYPVLEPHVWNLFDVLIVVLSFVDMQELQILRLLRLLKFVRAVPTLRRLMGGLVRSLISMVFIFTLLVVFIFIYGVVGATLFRENDPVHFGSLPLAMLSLAQCALQDNWTDILSINQHGCAKFIKYPTDGPNKCVASHPQSLIATVYFVTFILLSAIVVLNLVVGVISAGMEDTQSEIELDRQKKVLQRNDLALPYRRPKAFNAEANRLAAQFKAFNEKFFEAAEMHTSGRAVIDLTANSEALENLRVHQPVAPKKGSVAPSPSLKPKVFGEGEASNPTSPKAEAGVLSKVASLAGIQLQPERRGSCVHDGVESRIEEDLDEDDEETEDEDEGGVALQLPTFEEVRDAAPLYCARCQKEIDKDDDEDGDGDKEKDDDHDNNNSKDLVLVGDIGSFVENTNSPNLASQPDPVFHESDNQYFDKFDKLDLPSAAMRATPRSWSKFLQNPQKSLPPSYSPGPCVDVPYSSPHPWSKLQFDEIGKAAASPLGAAVSPAIMTNGCNFASLPYSISPLPVAPRLQEPVPPSATDPPTLTVSTPGAPQPHTTTTTTTKTVSYTPHGAHPSGDTPAGTGGAAPQPPSGTHRVSWSVNMTTETSGTGQAAASALPGSSVLPLDLRDPAEWGRLVSPQVRVPLPRTITSSPQRKVCESPIFSSGMSTPSGLPRSARLSNLNSPVATGEQFILGGTMFDTEELWRPHAPPGADQRRAMGGVKEAPQPSIDEDAPSILSPRAAGPSRLEPLKRSQIASSRDTGVLPMSGLKAQLPQDAGPTVLKEAAQDLDISACSDTPLLPGTTTPPAPDTSAQDQPPKAGFSFARTLSRTLPKWGGAKPGPLNDPAKPKPTLDLPLPPLDPSLVVDCLGGPGPGPLDSVY